jgi:hypothetical protein
MGRNICETKFATYKQRGEWVEMLFMARAVQRGFRVSGPGEIRAGMTFPRRMREGSGGCT